MTDAHLIVAHLVGLALTPGHEPQAWQRAIARLRDAVEQGDTLHAATEIARPATNQRPEEATQ